MSVETHHVTHQKTRICSCGCGESFHPKRRDQKFFNRKHYMDHYNIIIRKERNKSKNEVIKAISKNDRILKEFFHLYRKVKIATCHFNQLLVKGFDECYCTGVEISKEGIVECFYMFNFKYSINNNKINIEKL